MVEFILFAQLVTGQPPQQQNTYQPPAYQQPQVQQTNKPSVPTSKQIEQNEESIFDHPN